MKSVRAVYKLIRIYKTWSYTSCLKVHYIQLSNCSLTVQLDCLLLTIKSYWGRSFTDWSTLSMSNGTSFTLLSPCSCSRKRISSWLL